ncbi:hypothetical protein EB052_01750 [bacterium]|nr:hypothetical protein [bacterium]
MVAPPYNQNMKTASLLARYNGTIIKESLENPDILDDFITTKITVTGDENPADRWHIHDVEATREQLEMLSKIIKPTKYYAHFWDKDRNIIIVFRNKIFEFNFDNKSAWQPAIEHGLSVDIPREQLDFSISSQVIPEFGTKRENEERRDGGCGIVFDPATQMYAVGKQTDNGFFRLFSGGVDPKEDIREGVLREVVEESGLHDFLHVEQIAEAFAHYHNSLRNVNRVAKATCFLIILKSASLIPAKLEAHEKFSLAWATASDIFANWQTHGADGGCDHWIYFMKKAVARARELGYDTTSEQAE